MSTQSELLKTRFKDPKNHPMYGKFGKNAGNYKGINAVTNKTYYCIEKGCDNEITYHAWKYCSGRCKRCAMEIKWQDPEFRDRAVKATFEANNLSPNKPEKFLIKLLNKLLPNTYKFVGDGKLIVGGFCPDFVNKENNKIIEMYGDYWHNRPDYKKRDKRRLIAYKNYNYQTLIIWEHELKNLSKVKNKINRFNKKIKEDNLCQV